MDAITKKFRNFLFITLLLFLVAPVFAQVNNGPASGQFKSFSNKLAQVNLSFTFPDGFREIKAVNISSLPFDYAMEIPDADFEIWIQVNTQKENEKIVNEKNITANPDSLYVNIGQLASAELSDDKNFFPRGLPPYILTRYGADAGRIYMLNLSDSPVTKHYKYGFLTILQKNHSGTVLAICFANDKGADFFKNINKASNCLKFKP